MAELTTFSTLGIRSELIDALKANGITAPTPIQEKAIPVLLMGKDTISQAQTGTGKTLAFILPILSMADPQAKDVQALILTPTRELALQITAEVKKLLAKLDDIHVLAVYGGQDVDRQIRKLAGKKQIVIATPGRLLDHMRRGTIDLSHVSMLVLDEADQMLHMGFLPEVEEIVGQTPSERQTMLFSATMPAPVRSLANRFMRKPEDIRVQGKGITLDDIRQIVVETTDRAKQSTLRQLIDEYRPFLAVIFCRTKRRASTLNAALQGYGYASDELHGDLSQAKREDVMKRFREAKIQLLVATDVAARGLDVEGVTHVFNYDMPLDVDSYIHRIGRTGRGGEQGVAITLAAAKDRALLDSIEAGIRLSIDRQAKEDSRPRKQEKPGRDDQDHRGAKPGQSKGRPGGKSTNARNRRSGGPERNTGHAGRSASASDQKNERFDRKSAKSKPGTERKTSSADRRSNGTDRKNNSTDRKKYRFDSNGSSSERKADKPEGRKTNQRNPRKRTR